jgi:hypothetical protein
MSNIAAIHAKRVTVSAQDMTLVRRMRGLDDPGYKLGSDLNWGARAVKGSYDPADIVRAVLEDHQTQKETRDQAMQEHSQQEIALAAATLVPP